MSEKQMNTQNYLLNFDMNRSELNFTKELHLSAPINASEVARIAFLLINPKLCSLIVYCQFEVEKMRGFVVVGGYMIVGHFKLEQI